MDEEVYEAQGDRDIEGSWAGGKDGMRVTDMVLDQLDVRDIMNVYSFHSLNYRQDLLSPQGRFYLVAVKENDVPGIQSRILSKYGIQSEVCSYRTTWEVG